MLHFTNTTTYSTNDPGRRWDPGLPQRLHRLGAGAPFVARRAVNLHGCALPHFAPLLRRLRRGLPRGGEPGLFPFRDSAPNHGYVPEPQFPHHLGGSVCSGSGPAVDEVELGPIAFRHFVPERGGLIIDHHGAFDPLRIELLRSTDVQQDEPGIPGPFPDRFPGLGGGQVRIPAVSYTHLTLPTIYSV